MRTKYLFPFVVSGVLAGSSATSGDNVVEPRSTRQLVVSQFHDGIFKPVRHSIDMERSGRIVFDVGPFDEYAPLYVDYRDTGDLPLPPAD